MWRLFLLFLCGLSAETAGLEAAWRVPCRAVPGCGASALGYRQGVEGRRGSVCSTTRLVGLRGGLVDGLQRDSTSPGRHDLSPPTSPRASSKGGSEGGGAEAERATGPGAWTAARLEEGFSQLQGELALSVGGSGSADGPLAEHDHALQERVGELSRSAIELFRSQLQLFLRQQQRQSGSGGARCSRGLLLLFEGLDRSGKGTQVERLIAALEVALCAFRCTPLLKMCACSSKQGGSNSCAHLV